MSGKQLRHCRLIEKNKATPITTLEQFFEQVRLQFTPRESSRLARDRLAHLTQKGTVTKYTDDFFEITMGIPTITEEELVDRYVRGLRKGLPEEIETRADMTSLSDVIRIAERMDAHRNTATQFVPWPRRTYDAVPQVWALSG